MARLKICLLIVAVAVVWHVALIANPGFYNHDELQRADDLKSMGLAEYVKTYAQIKPGECFETPVRPVSFLVQGALSYPVYVAPYLTHLGSVLMHAAACCLLFFMLARMETTREAALPAALLFAISPLATFATGWAAALMDRLYVSFGLGAGWVAVTSERRPAARTAAGIFALTVLALFSKETAVVLPAAALLLAWHGWANRAAWFSRSRAAAVVAGTLAPVAAYLAFRWPALEASVSGSASAPHYALSAVGSISRIEIYLAYPFLRNLTDAGGAGLMPVAYLAFGILAHVVLVWSLNAVYGRRAAALYLACYIVPLTPILFIAGIGSHYLYASGLALSSALALLLVHAWKEKKRLMQCLLVLLVLVLASHSQRNQMYIYSIGRCMNRAMTSLEAKHLTMGRPARIRIDADKGAPVHVLHRFTTGRDRVGESAPVRFEVTQDPSRPLDASTVRFSTGCLCY
ncbi:MAG: glycosyltransferase family 39 protein [Bryobacteraceae bacterium]|nr:glycosyltransferase family 39 protein [Bryobacteraceae bacterium]